MSLSSYLLGQAQSEEKRLNSSELFDFALQKILNARKEYEEKGELQLIEPLKGSTVYGAKVSANKRSLVLMSPACDRNDSSSPSAGTSNLKEVLNRVADLQKQKENADQIYIVPMAQTQGITSGILERNHWTILIIQDKQCYFFDPKKGLGAACYSYLLDPLAKLVSDAGYSLAAQIYLPWQTESIFTSGNDDVNCGRYNGAISELAATAWFSNKAKKLEELKNIIEIEANIPQLGLLIKESNSVIADRRLMANKAIVKARNWGFLAARQTRKDLLDGLRPEQENQTLKEAIQKHFFEEGQGGFKQFNRETSSAGNNVFYGGVKDGNNVFHGGTKQCDLRSETESEAEEKLVIALKCSKAEAKQVIAALSQGPDAFIPLLLDKGIKESEPSIKIVPPGSESLKVRVVKVNGQLTRLCRYENLQIKSKNDHTVVLGKIKGPIEVSYHLTQNKDGKWGWQLHQVETQNQDILRILHGKLLPEQYIIDQYCPARSNKEESPKKEDSASSTVQDDYFEESKEEKEDSVEVSEDREYLKQLQLAQELALNEMKDTLRTQAKEKEELLHKLNEAKVENDGLRIKVGEQAKLVQTIPQKDFLIQRIGDELKDARQKLQGQMTTNSQVAVQVPLQQDERIKRLQQELSDLRVGQLLHESEAKAAYDKALQQKDRMIGELQKEFKEQGETHQNSLKSLTNSSAMAHTLVLQQKDQRIAQLQEELKEQGETLKSSLQSQANSLATAHTLALQQKDQRIAQLQNELKEQGEIHQNSLQSQANSSAMAHSLALLQKDKHIGALEKELKEQGETQKMLQLQVSSSATAHTLALQHRDQRISQLQKEFKEQGDTHQHSLKSLANSSATAHTLALQQKDQRIAQLQEELKEQGVAHQNRLQAQASGSATAHTLALQQKDQRIAQLQRELKEQGETHQNRLQSQANSSATAHAMTLQQKEQQIAQLQNELRTLGENQKRMQAQANTSVTTHNQALQERAIRIQQLENDLNELRQAQQKQRDIYNQAVQRKDGLIQNFGQENNELRNALRSQENSTQAANESLQQRELEIRRLRQQLQDARAAQQPQTNANPDSAVQNTPTDDSELQNLRDQLAQVRLDNQNLRQQLESSPKVPKKKPTWWKYLLIGGLIALGATAIAFGVTGLLGVVLLAQAAAIALTAGGAAATISGGVFAGLAVRKDKNPTGPSQDPSQANSLVPQVHKKNAKRTDQVRQHPIPGSSASLVNFSSLFQQGAKKKGHAPEPRPWASKGCSRAR